MRFHCLVVMLLAGCCFCGVEVGFTKDLYVSTTGSDSVSYVNNDQAHPWATPGRAFQLAQGGDTVYLRGGVYGLSAPLTTVNAGGAGSPISVKAYPLEAVTISGDGLGELIFVEKPYWIFDGIHFELRNMPDHDHAIITIGYNYDGSHAVIQNCSFHLVSSVGHDNISCIRLQAYRSNYATIRNNTIRGQGVNNSVSYNCGIQYLGGGNVGTKILNNDIYDNALGIYIKHANSDTSILSGAEIAYNYIYNAANRGIYGNPIYMHIHNNITNGIDFGDNGGGPQGRNNVVEQNTSFTASTHGIYLRSPSEGPIQGCTIRSNILTKRTTEAYNGDTLNLNSWSYNMYGNSSAQGVGDIAYTYPTFVGGSVPSSVAGFALADGSYGKRAAIDGRDLGADVSLVGRQVAQGLQAPTNLGIVGQ